MEENRIDGRITQESRWRRKYAVSEHKIPENDQLGIGKLSADIARLGGRVSYLPDVETIIAEVKLHAKSGDVVAVLSNGGFGGIHQKLLDAFG